MTMRQRGRDLEQTVAAKSRTVGRDMKKGMVRVGKSTERGAGTVVRDVEGAGRKVGIATRRDADDVTKRLRRNRRAPASP
jgi:hypothetical protein